MNVMSKFLLLRASVQSLSAELADTVPGIIHLIGLILSHSAHCQNYHQNLNNTWEFLGRQACSPLVTELNKYKQVNRANCRLTSVHCKPSDPVQNTFTELTSLLSNVRDIPQMR